MLRNYIEKNAVSVGRLNAERTIKETCLRFCAIGGLDVIHNVNMDIAQDDSLLRQIRGFPKDATKYHSRLCRRDLDGGFDTLKAVWGNGVYCWSFDDFKVSERCEIHTEVLQGVR